MFTGIVEIVGKVVSLRRGSKGARLAIESGLDGLEPGDSIAVNGACQTVASLDGKKFTCDVLPETLRVTNLGGLKPGSKVNLERAMLSGGRLGGHIVNGHIDGTGTIRRVSGKSTRLDISVDTDIARYIVSKGSVAVDGVSLTVGPGPGRDTFVVFIIPHTLENTNLCELVPGKKVNIEIDILAKYVYKFTRP